VDAPSGPAEPLYATASRELSTGEVIVKVVNVSAVPQQLQIDLEGVQNVSSEATALVMTGQPGDVNTVEDPEKVAPKTERLKGVGRSFLHEFPAYSVSVIRLKAK